jgi:intracellular septation protein
LPLSKKAAVRIRTIVDYAGLIAFLGALVITRNFQLATWVLIIGSVLALAIGWLVERRLAPMPLLSGGAALVFGTLTLVLHDKAFVKMKMTFVDAALAITLIAGFVARRNPLKAIMGESLRLPDEAWRALTIRYAIFFAACAAANEVVWRTQSDSTWGLFRLAALGAAIVFSFAQAPFLMKHLHDEGEAPAVLEPPDAGF